MVRQPPAPEKTGPRHRQPRPPPRAQEVFVPPLVQPHHHGVVPHGPKGQADVLHDQHRTAALQLGHQLGGAALDRVRQAAVAPTRRQQLELQAAPPLWQIELRGQLPGRHINPGGAQHGGQGRRAALVRLLREERRRGQLHGERYPGVARPRRRVGCTVAAAPGQRQHHRQAERRPPRPPPPPRRVEPEGGAGAGPVLRPLAACSATNQERSGLAPAPPRHDRQDPTDP